MRTVILWCTAIPLCVLAACSGASSYRENASATEYADSTSTSTVAEPLNSPARKMIRTASIRARVDNTIDVTTKLETLVTSLSGAVMESTLHNEVMQTNEYPYKSDSVKKVQVYIPTAHLVLRVPVMYVDSVVHSIGRVAAFTSYRMLKQKDVTIRYASNEMKIGTGGKSLPKPVKVVNKSTLEAAKYNDNKADIAIDRIVENMQVDDNVAYATLEVDFFQGQQADVQIVIDPGVVTRAYFGSEVLTALRQGADSLRSIVIFLLECWPFWMLGIIVWLSLRKRLRIPKRVVNNPAV